MYQTNIKILGSRHIEYSIECIEWSNKMDLVAYGHSNGEVVVQRLNWQKVSTFQSPGKNIKVRSLSWKQDETYIAVGYSNGQVSLLNIETEEQISSFNYEGEDIKKIRFSKTITCPDFKNIYRNHMELKYDSFLPSLPPISNRRTNAYPSDEKNPAKGSPCFLLITLASGKLHLLFSAAMSMATIDLTRNIRNHDWFEVYDVCTSNDLHGLYAFVRDGNMLKLLYYNSTLLDGHMSPLLHFFNHCAHILEMKSYINETLHSIQEGWETVQMEMDNQLTQYTNSHSKGSISADFLELLVFGCAPSDMAQFLINDIKEKGLKKLANSVDVSYSTIQHLIRKHLQSAAIALFYFVNTLSGLSRIEYFFKPFISTKCAENALRLAGGFIMKILEMEQVVDQCVNDMKLFFCWLCVVITRMHQQEIGDDLKIISPEDTIYLADYLNTFEDDDNESTIDSATGITTKCHFNLSKVGQYLKDENLSHLAKNDIHHLWKKLHEENECLMNCVQIFPHEKALSLIQQRNKLFASINELFHEPNGSINSTYFLKTTVICKTLPPDFEPCTTFYTNSATRCDCMAVTISTEDVLILEFDTKSEMIRSVCVALNRHNAPTSPQMETLDKYQHLSILHLQFYNENTISLLLKCNADITKRNYFVQLPLEELKRKTNPIHQSKNINLNIDSYDTETMKYMSIYDFIDENTFKLLDGSNILLAVSGTRKVATILSDDKRQLFMLEMEVEEDEEDTEMSRNSPLEVSKDSTSRE